MNALARGGLSLVLGLGATALSVGCSAPQGENEVTVDAPPTIWTPKPGTSWQVQFSGTVDTSVEAEVFDIDGADSSAALVKTLHAQGARVICYISAGSWEDWRNDADAFPDAVKGKELDGWPGERWLDIRRLDILLPIMDERMAACRAKGFDAVDPDNLDGYTQDSGFTITAADQLTYNKEIARLAHRHGMGVGLKNDPEQVADLLPHFDFAVVEQCVVYGECAAWTPFITAGKAVLHVEYDGTMSEICAATKPLGFSTIKKHLNLDAYRMVC